MATVTFNENDDMDLIRSIIRIFSDNQTNQNNNIQSTLPNNQSNEEEDMVGGGEPASDKQLYYLKQNNIPFTDKITKSQAFNLIKNHKNGGNP